MDGLVTRAVGSRRYRVTLRGPGGHSLKAFGTVNPAPALAETILGLSRVEVPSEPLTSYCASVIGGGTSINAIPEEVWVEIDLRSTDADELARPDAALHALIETAVTTENARGDTKNGRIIAEVQLIGDRPAGSTDEESPIVRASLAALQMHGFSPRLTASSTDANVPMSLGIPAVMIGTGGTGGRAHTIEEWIDIDMDESMRGISAAVAASSASRP